MHGFPWLGGHDPVELVILREVIDKWQDHVTENQDTFAGIGIADMPGLFTGNVQALTENLPVAACLVQQINKIAVLEDIFNLRGGKEVLDILCDAGGDLM